MSQQTFKKWKPGVWAALNTGLCTLEEEEEDERGQAIQIQKGMPSSSLEEQHLASYANVSFDSVFVRLSLCRNPSDPPGVRFSKDPKTSRARRLFGALFG